MSIRYERIQLRLSAKVKLLIRQAAAISGQSLQNFIRAVLAERAQKVVERHSTTTLTRRDWKRFLTIIERDKEPAAALRAAVSWLDSDSESGAGKNS